MFSVLLALLVAAVVMTAGTLLFEVTSGIFLGLVAGGVVFFLLVRKAVRQVEGAGKEVEAHIKAGRVDKAIAALESLRPRAKWQPMLGSAIDGQVGMLKYAHQRDFEGACPLLEKSPAKLWHAWAMLGAVHFKKKRYDEMQAVFEKAVKRNRKQSLLWATYAWCEWKRGEKDKAVAILKRGLEKLPGDQRLKSELGQLEKGKKPKMTGYGPEWMVLQLDAPLPAMNPAASQSRFMPPPHKLGLRKGGRVRFN